VHTVDNDINHIIKGSDGLAVSSLQVGHRKAKGYIQPDEFTDLEKNPKTIEQQSG
jgi:hypothetical protein